MVNQSHRTCLIQIVVVIPLLPPFPLHAQQLDGCLDDAVTQAALNCCAADHTERMKAAMDSVYVRLPESAA